MNTNISRKQQIMWINEKYDLDLFYQNLEDDNPAMVDEFCDMWYNDLQDLKESSKQDLLDGANSILKWWGIDLTVVDLDWEPGDNCFVWKVQ